jgi:hypothetical protein
MSTKRTIVNRPRRPAAPDDVLELFTALEAIPQRRRHENLELRAKERALHEALNLYDEWRFSCCSVLDREAAPCWPPEYPAHKAWHKVRGVRLELLAAIKETAPTMG